ncbi:MAG: Ribose 5-phosphate isomerase B / Galactose 6-phosphate isomerase, partial [uncultured Nocardioides sp.]
ARSPGLRPRRPRAEGPPDDLAHRRWPRGGRPRPLRPRPPRRLPRVLPACGGGCGGRPGRGADEPRCGHRRLGQRRADRRQQGPGRPVRAGLVGGDGRPGAGAQRRQRRLRGRSDALPRGDDQVRRGVPVHLLPRRRAPRAPHRPGHGLRRDEGAAAAPRVRAPPRHRRRLDGCL